MNNITKLQSLCEVRWFSCVNALYALKSTFTVVVTAQECLEEDVEGKADPSIRSSESIPQQPVNLTPKRIVQLYEVFQDNMLGDLVS